MQTLLLLHWNHICTDIVYNIHGQTPSIHGINLHSHNSPESEATRVLFFQLPANFYHSFLIIKHVLVKRVKEAEYGSEILLVFPLFQYVCYQCCLCVVLATFLHPQSFALAWAFLILMLILNISSTLLLLNYSVRSHLQI